MCECCNNESHGRDIGVASVPGVPMSIMWCDNCIRNPNGIVIPQSAAVYFFIFVAGGNPDNLIDEVKEYYTWADGKYMPITKFWKRITTKQVEKELKKYEEAMNNMTDQRTTRERLERLSSDLEIALTDESISSFPKVYKKLISELDDIIAEMEEEDVKEENQNEEEKL